MGCDIHAYLELVTEDTFFDPPQTDVECIAEDITIGRYYGLFGLMAGVRGSATPVCLPKGIPRPISDAVHSHYYDFVAPEDKERQEMFVYGGWGKWEDETHQYVSSSDWHNPSWLTLDELKEVQRRFSEFKDQEGKPVGEHMILASVIAMMQVLDDRSGGYSRLVFWFDN